MNESVYIYIYIYIYIYKYIYIGLLYTKKNNYRAVQSQNSGSDWLDLQ